MSDGMSTETRILLQSCDMYRAENTTLRAEVARLREALAWLAERAPHPYDVTARAALQETRHE